jgi:MGT family glycosyltransferase
VSRILFVVPPWTGHVNPTISVARELTARGHEVAWAGHEGVIGRLLPEGSRLFALAERVEDAAIADRMAASRKVRHLESVKFLWEALLVPLARGMREPIEKVLAEYRPDLVVVDHQAIGGAMAARAAGVPWASFCTTSASVMPNFAGLPKVEAWVNEQLASLERDAGLPASPTPDLSPDLVVVFSTPALVGPAAFPAHYRFVGPSISDRPDATPFPWEALDPTRRLVFISLGTISADRDTRFYDVVSEAVAGTPWQAVVVAPDGMMPSPPDSVIARPRVPQLALLPRVDAVVSHAGHNTVCETLAQGKPLVVTPIRDDQPVIADQVVKAGAGLRLHFGRLTPRALRETIGRVLDEPGFAEAAGRIRTSFAAAGGALAAAELLAERAQGGRA